MFNIICKKKKEKKNLSVIWRWKIRNKLPFGTKVVASSSVWKIVRKHPASLHQGTAISSVAVIQMSCLNSFSTLCMWSDLSVYTVNDNCYPHGSQIQLVLTKSDYFVGLKNALISKRRGGEKTCFSPDSHSPVLHVDCRGALLQNPSLHRHGIERAVTSVWGTGLLLVSAKRPTLCVEKPWSRQR